MSRAGLRNRHGIIESSTLLPNSYGERIATWTEYARRWGRIRALSGKEQLQAKQVNASTTHEITVLYCEGLTPAMRYRYGERVFNISSVNDVEDRHHEMILMCEEAVA